MNFIYISTLALLIIIIVTITIIFRHKKAVAEYKRKKQILEKYKTRSDEIGNLLKTNLTFTQMIQLKTEIDNIREAIKNL